MFTPLTGGTAPVAGASDAVGLSPSSPPNTGHSIHVFYPLSPLSCLLLSSLSGSPRCPRCPRYPFSPRSFLLFLLFFFFSRRYSDSDFLSRTRSSSGEPPDVARALVTRVAGELNHLSTSRHHSLPMMTTVTFARDRPIGKQERIIVSGKKRVFDSCS